MHLFLLFVNSGGGSYLVQVIAAVLGVVFFFKNIKLYIRTFFTRSFRKQKYRPSA